MTQPLLPCSACPSACRLIIFRAISLLLVFLVCLFYRSVMAAPLVIELQVSDIISPASADFIQRGLDTAAAEDAQLAIIRLDTPGGLDSSMRAIVRHILASPVPVATYVAPGGARAASAGTFILYASHIAAMAPASNLGAATPVQIGIGSPEGNGKPLPSGSDSPDKTAPTNSGEKNGKNSAAKPTDTSSRKAANDAAAYLRSLAQLRKRNPDFAERAVYEASSLSAHEAIEAQVIDIIATSTSNLLEQLNGQTVTLDSGATVTLDTANAEVRQIQPDLRNRILGLIANPQVALILMMIGIYGLFYEVTSPGVGLPGIAGLIALLLGLYAFQLLPVNWTGVALLFVGIALMIAEAFIPSFGVIGTGGVIAFVLGGLFLTDTDIPEYDLSIGFLMGTAIVSAALLIAIATLAIQSHRRKIISGQEEMIGLEGKVTSIAPEGNYAHVRGESWQVITDGPLSVGDRIKVTQINGLVLTVIRLDT